MRHIYSLWFNWRDSNFGSLLSPTVVYPMLGDFAESAQPTVHFNTQTATQPSRFSDIQLNEVSSSNQSTVAPSDCPTVSPNEPTPSTAATPTASAGTIVKASNLSPLPSVPKLGTSDARTYMPGSAPNWSRHTPGVAVQSADARNQLNCRQSLCEKQQDCQTV